MIIDKIVRNVYAIGGGIILAAFGISFVSTKARRINLEYPTQQEFTGPIDSVSSIENLEYSKGCKFYFYDSKLVGNNANFKISNSRDFNIDENGKKSMFEKVTNDVEKCKKGRFFYYKI